MKKNIIWIVFLISSIAGLQAQPAKQLLTQCYQKFAKANDYKADAQLFFDVPGVNLQKAQGKVFYKKPKKFKIKLKGIAFLPKQNPFDFFDVLIDSSSYAAVPLGAEMLQGQSLEAINIVPLKAGDLIAAKCWVDKTAKNVVQYELTTRSNGTILVTQTIGTQQQYGLPDVLVFTFDAAKFKVPKAVAMDINSKKKAATKKEAAKGTITIQLRNYKINTRFKDSEMADDKQ